MHKNTAQNILGIAMALIGFVGLSVGDALVKKVSLDHTIYFAGFFEVFSGLIILFVLSITVFRRDPLQIIRTKSLKLQLLRGSIVTVLFVTFLYAVTNMQTAQLYTIAFLSPFILAIMAHFILKEKMRLHSMIAVAIGFTGILIAVGPSEISVGTPLIAAFAVPVLFAVGQLIIKFISQDDHYLTYSFYIYILQLPVVGILMLLDQDFKIYFPTLQEWGWLVGSAAAYTFGISLLALAMYKTSAANVGVTQYTSIIWGALLGYVLFAEIPSIMLFLGAAIIIASGIYLIYTEKKAG